MSKRYVNEGNRRSKLQKMAFLLPLVFALFVSGTFCAQGQDRVDIEFTGKSIEKVTFEKEADFDSQSTTAPMLGGTQDMTYTLYSDDDADAIENIVDYLNAVITAPANNTPIIVDFARRDTALKYPGPTPDDPALVVPAEVQSGTIIFDNGVHAAANETQNTQIERYSFNSLVLRELSHDLGLNFLPSTNVAIDDTTDPANPTITFSDNPLDPQGLGGSVALPTGDPVVSDTVYPFNPAQPWLYTGDASKTYGDDWIDGVVDNDETAIPIDVNTDHTDTQSTEGPFSHIAIPGAAMSFDAARPFYSEVELRLLEDAGHVVDVDNFFGHSIYQVHTDPIAIDEDFTVDGIYGVGLHLVYNTDTTGNTVNQNGNLTAEGKYGTGIRVEGSNNKITIADTSTVKATGEQGIGVVVTGMTSDKGTVYASTGTELTNYGTIEATGADGTGVYFNAAITKFDNYGTIRAIQADNTRNNAIYIADGATVTDVNFFDGTKIYGNIVSDSGNATNYNITGTTTFYGDRTAGADVVDIGNLSTMRFGTDDILDVDPITAQEFGRLTFASGTLAMDTGSTLKASISANGQSSDRISFDANNPDTSAVIQDGIFIDIAQLEEGNFMLISADTMSYTDNSAIVRLFGTIALTDGMQTLPVHYGHKGNLDVRTEKIDSAQVGDDGLHLIIGYDTINLDLKWTGTENNNWNITSKNWSDVDQIFVNGDAVTFDLEANPAYTIAVAAAGVNVGDMTVEGTSDWTFTGGGITGAVGNITQADNTTLASSGALTKNDSGKLTFQNEVAFAGTSVVNGGTVQIGVGGVGGSFIGDMNVNDGSTLQVGDGAVGTFTGTATVSLNGLLKIGNGGTGGAFDGNIVNNGIPVTGEPIASAGVVFNHDSNEHTYTGKIDGNGFTSKDGDGTLILTGNNTNTGNFYVNGGTLQIGNGGTSGSIANELIGIGANKLEFNREGDVSINQNQKIVGTGGTVTQNGVTDDSTLFVNGTLEGVNVFVTNGTLGGVGEIKTSNSQGGSVSLRNGTSLAPGEGGGGGDIGTLSIARNLSFAANSTFYVDLGMPDENSTSPFIESDYVKVGNRVNLDGNLVLDLHNPYRAGAYLLISAGSNSITGTDLMIGTIPDEDHIKIDGVSIRDINSVDSFGRLSNITPTVKKENNQLILTIAASVANVSNVWTGAVDQTTWDITTGNWNNTEDNHFLGGDAVTFDLSSGGTHSITMASGSTKTVADMTVTGTDNWTFNGNINGTNAPTQTTLDGYTGSLMVGTDTQDFTGTLTFGGKMNFSGNAAVNSGTVMFNSDAVFGGAVTVNTGAVVTFNGVTSAVNGATVNRGSSMTIGNGGTTGDFAGNIANHGRVNFRRIDDMTYGNVMSGSGVLAKTGSGTLYLTNNNTYTGPTNINGGTLSIGNGGTAGDVMSTIINVNANRLEYNRSNEAVIRSSQTVNGTGGTLRQAGSGTLFLDGTTSGVAVIAERGTLGGIGTIGAAAAGSAALTINSGATLSPGPSAGLTGFGTGTLTVNGDVVFESGSTYLYEVNNATGVNQNDLLVADGTVTIQPGAILDIVLAQPGEKDNYFQVIQADAFSADGQTFIHNEQDAEDTKLFTIRGKWGLQFGHGVTTRGTNSGYYIWWEAVAPDFSGHLQALTNVTPNALQVAGGIDDMVNAYTDPNNPLGGSLNDLYDIDIYNALVNMNTDDPQTLADAYASLHGEVFAANKEAATQLQRGFQKLMPTGREIVKLSDLTKLTNRWGTFTGGWQGRKDIGAYSGYDLISSGFAVGIDRTVTPNVLLGVALGYDYASQDFDSIQSQSQMDALRTMVYGSWFNGTAFIDAYGGYTKNFYETERKINFNNYAAVARGKYNDDMGSVGFTVGKSLWYGNNLITPSIGFHYLHMSGPDLTETDGGTANLRVVNNQFQSLRMPIGVKVSQTFAEKFGLVWTPEARIYYIREWMDDSARVQTEFASLQGAGGIQFNADSGKWGRDSGRAGLGLNAQLANRLNLRFDYDYEFYKYTSANVFSATLGANW